MIRCTVHQHSSERSAVRCAEKAFKRRNGQRLWKIDTTLERLASKPAPHRVVKHRPPRVVRRGFVELLVWSEATVLMY